MTLQTTDAPLLDAEKISRTLTAALRSGGDYAEIFVEDKRSSSASFDDGKVEELVSGRRRGAGIRVVTRSSTGFAHTADLSLGGLTAAAEVAAAAARAGGGAGSPESLRQIRSEPLNEVVIPPSAVGGGRKVGLLKLADDTARAEGDAIRQVACAYGDSSRRILVADSNGLLAADEQVKTFLAVSCMAMGDGGMQTGRESRGQAMGFELFEEVDVVELVRTAARRALTKLSAHPAPSGSMPVIIGPGGGGVLFHEACGHGLEADLIERGASVFGGRLGEQVAHEGVTLIDDGTMAPQWGCYSIDDEGRASQQNILIKDGVLLDYMWDRRRAERAGRVGTGNGRRESYRHLPMVRMTNTYIANGETDPEDIVADTPKGVYVAHLGGGQVNTATGDFVFGMTEAYLVENGRLTAPLREGNLIGNGPEVLRLIDAIGNDFAMGSPGTCGKDGQGVPVGDGTPTLRVGRLTVGGTAA